MNNIIIIGNGFDLAHGLKTSYKDFINHVKEDILVNPHLYQDLISIGESFISNYEMIKFILNKSNSSSPLLDIKWNSSLFQDIYFQALPFGH